MNSSKQLKYGTLLTYISTCLGILTGLLYTPWMLKQIGEDDYALYSLSISIISIFMMDFGLGAAITKYVAKYRITKNETGLSHFLGLVYKIYFIIDSILFFILSFIFINLSNIYTAFSAPQMEILQKIFLVISFYSLVSFPMIPFQNILQAYEKYIFLKGLDILKKIVTVVFMILFLKLGYGVYALVIVNVGVGLFIQIWYYGFLKARTPAKADLKYFNKELSLEIIGFSIWSTVILICQRLILNIEPSILGKFSNTKEITVFSFGMTIEGYIWTFTNAIGSLLIPYITRITYEDQSQRKFDDLMIHIGRLQGSIMGLILVEFLCFGREFVFMWLGKEYETVYFVALFISVPLIVSSTEVVASNKMIVDDKIHLEAYRYIVSSLVSVICSICFCRIAGAIGAAAGVCLGYIAGDFIVANWNYRRALGVPIFSFFKRCYLPLAGIMFISISIGFILKQRIEVMSWGTFILNCTIIALIYLVGIYVFYWKKKEREQLVSFLNRK